jgi:hypothetical protein
MLQVFDLTNKTNYGSNSRATAGTLLTLEGFIHPASSLMSRVFVRESGARFTLEQAKRRPARDAAGQAMYYTAGRGER